MRRATLFLSVVLVLSATLAAAVPPPPGPFAQGKVRVGLYGGAASTLGNTYVLLGAGAGFYVLNGLEAGLDYEAWIGASPSIQKLTPQLRYVIWQVGHIKPYAGLFWRHTFMGDNWNDYDSWGSRFGLAFQKGRSYVAVGVVYERYIDNDDILFTDDSQIYPEIAFWLSF
ncbi:hypothetical protein DRQ50_00885 [bacterium]|nr:MAG: hypothetical protein DRQ50_00885 [bacterium]